MKEGFYFVHIGDNNYALTHSSFIRHSDRVHRPEEGPVKNLLDPPSGCNNPNCQCMLNPDGTWKVVCN